MIGCMEQSFRVSRAIISFAHLNALMMLEQ